MSLLYPYRRPTVYHVDPDEYARMKEEEADLSLRVRCDKEDRKDTALVKHLLGLRYKIAKDDYFRRLYHLKARGKSTDKTLERLSARLDRATANLDHNRL